MAAPPRAPIPSDFPSNLTLTITPPLSHLPATNVLILLHGLGDTHIPFTRLARNFKLPESVCIALRGPNPIPPLFIDSETPAFHWGDDLLLDERTGEIDMDGGGLETARKVLMDVVVEEVLIGKCGYPRKNILFFGYGQGGMAALYAVAATPTSSSQSASGSQDISSSFGGIISIGACLPSSYSVPPSSFKNRTPTLILGGSRSSNVTQDKLKKIKALYQEVEYVKWSKSHDAMPACREELLPIMSFFGRKLKSVSGVPEGALEV